VARDAAGGGGCGLAARARAALAALAADAAGARAARADAAHLFSRMELCAGGDAESFLRALDTPGGAGGSLDAAARGALARALVWQVTFGLYAARERLALRHFDVKLLNVLLAAPRAAPAGAPAPHSAPDAPAAPLALCYALGARRFAVRAAPPLLVAKIADFGSASTDARAAAAPPRVAAAQWTTLENAPPEFFLAGDAARAGWGADTFALGLAALHALLGAPYEEPLAAARAPRALRDALVQEWRAAPAARVLRAVARGDAETWELLADTLYRFAAMLGPPPRGGRAAALLRAAAGCDDDDDENASATAAAPATAAPTTTARPAAPAPRRGRAAAAAAAAPPPPPLLPPAALAAARAAFAADTAAWSLERGAAPPMAAARARAAAGAPGLWALLSALCAWEPAARPTLRAALAHAAFAPLAVDGAWPAGADVYDFYARDEDGEVPDL